MDSCELAYFVTTIACTIAKCVPKEDLPTLAAVLGQLGSTLATITVQDQTSKSNEIPADVASNNEIIALPSNSINDNTSK